MATDVLAMPGAGQIPLPDGLGQVKLPVGQVYFSKVFFYILYKHVEKIKNFGSWANKKVWIHQALLEPGHQQLC